MANPDTDTQTVEELRDPQQAREMPPRDEPVREDAAPPETEADVRVPDEEVARPDDVEAAPEPPDVRGEHDHGENDYAVGRAAVAEPEAERDAVVADDAAAERDAVVADDAAAERDAVTEPVDDRVDGAREPAAAEPTGLLPGAEPVTPVSPLWSGDASRTLRDRFRELQVGFLDDPRSAAAAADALVGETIDSLRSALTEQHREMQAWQNTGADDTEQLRVAVQRYRDFLDRVLAL